MRKLLLALFALCLCAVSALAEERIRGFNVVIRVHADSSIEVTETIAVDSEGLEIKRGILRDIPTSYVGHAGERASMGLEVLGVKKDNAPENHIIENLNNGVRIRIGRPDIFLQPGTHVYEITYHVTHALGFFKDYDELYWNVTGNNWSLPIETASIKIELPAGAGILRSAGYTGVQDAQGQDFRVTLGAGSRYEAETTDRLSPGEGFTVAVAWQKGIVFPTVDDLVPGIAADLINVILVFVILVGVIL